MCQIKGVLIDTRLKQRLSEEEQTLRKFISAQGAFLFIHGTSFQTLSFKSITLLQKLASRSIEFILTQTMFYFR